MIHYVQGNLFDSKAKVLVNAIDTVGVMGAGIAKDFKERYPDMFDRYQVLCSTNKLNVGQLWLYKTQDKWILGFPTKKHWRDPSKIEYIEAGLKKPKDSYREKEITSIAFPKLGCGLGGLNWETQVQPLMDYYLGQIEADVFIYTTTSKIKIAGGIQTC